MTYKIWFVIWVNSESCIILTRRKKRAAKEALRDLRRDFPTTVFGMKRLIEPITPKRKRKRRRRAKPPIPPLPDNFTIRTREAE
jgi:hypothetical protein